MKRDFNQLTWDNQLLKAAKDLIRIAIWEDNEDIGDITSAALIPESIQGEAAVVSREEGIAAGFAAAETILSMIDPRLQWIPSVFDGEAVHPGTVLGVISGPVRTMLTAERLLLNLTGRLSGIATQTARYVRQTEGTKARIYDTRKTTMGWRRLEKYAVHCGGGFNHRTGLFDAMLIKDNHLASAHEEGLTVAEAVRRGKNYIAAHYASSDQAPLIEVEVDSLDQLIEVLPEEPDIVLLDNMPPEMMKKAVALRDEKKVQTELEASGGINLETVRAAAESGVDRVSVGALTHSARSLDLGLDWRKS